MDKIKENIDSVCKKAFYDRLRQDLDCVPPKTEHIEVLIDELILALCKFVPNKQRIHEQIRKDLKIKVSSDTMGPLVLALIAWIEKFHAPVDDKRTRKWRHELQTCANCNDFIIRFLKEYYEHLEKTYVSLIEARVRVANGQSAIPPEHRQKDGNVRMKTGR